MLDSIIHSAKAEIGEKLSEKGVSGAQLDAVLGLAKTSILSEFKMSATGGNWSSIINLFNGSQSIHDSSLTNNIVIDFAGQLMVKMGFSASISRSIAEFTIPTILNIINQKTPTEGISETNLSELTGGVLSGEKSNLLSKIGKLF